MVARVMNEYGHDNVMVRSILSGPGEKGSEQFEKDVWFDLDQSRRQPLLDGKSFRDAQQYITLGAKPIQCMQEIKDRLAQINGSWGAAKKYIKQMEAAENPMVIIEKLKREMKNCSDDLQKKIIEYAIAEYQYQVSGER